MCVWKPISARISILMAPTLICGVARYFTCLPLPHLSAPLHTVTYTFSVFFCLPCRFLSYLSLPVTPLSPSCHVLSPHVSTCLFSLHVSICLLRLLMSLLPPMSPHVTSVCLPLSQCSLSPQSPLSLTLLCISPIHNTIFSVSSVAPYLPVSFLSACVTFLSTLCPLVSFCPHCLLYVSSPPLSPCVFPVSSFLLCLHCLPSIPYDP